MPDADEYPLTGNDDPIAVELDLENDDDIREDAAVYVYHLFTW
jgi:hypothetical protein